MANISTGILGEANLLNLRQISIDEIRAEVHSLLIPGENAIAAYTTVRDQVIFTSKRVLVVNVQGITGKKVSYFSYPYSKVSYFGVETAGVLDIDSELKLIFNDGSRVQFDFKSHVDIKKICATISQYVL